jgi:hypothetical protein
MRTSVAKTGWSAAGCPTSCATELPDAVLIRPDSYVAWASERLLDAAELAAAVDRWTRVT